MARALSHLPDHHHGAIRAGRGVWFVHFVDAPGPDKSAATIISLWRASLRRRLGFRSSSLSLVCVIAIVLSWFVHSRKKWDASCAVALPPMINVVGGGGAVLWLEMLNRGHLGQ